jgi:Spy/CpxP family protein refolding chaperone
MTDAQAKSIDTALTQWQSAVANRPDGKHRRMKGMDGVAGGIFPPAAKFLSACGEVLQTDQFVALADYLKGIQAEHRSQIREARQPFDGMVADRMVRRLVDQLALTPDQEKQVRAIFQELRESRMAARSSGRDSVISDASEFSRHREELTRRLSSVLTADQLTQFKSLGEKRHNRREANRKWEADRSERRDRRTANAVQCLQGVLQLSDGQSAQIKQMLASLPAPEPPDGGTACPMGPIRRPLMAGAEQFHRAESQIRTVLSPDQVKRLDAVLQLLPGRQERL